MDSREFAIDVVKRLHEAGHLALWAGGCVRDQLLGKIPKDYDVATGANPDQVREVFGKKRTLPIGASFGVITVLGPKGTEPIEVATFRRDGGYSDGRRPDTIEFTDAREDARRRDFTINGMFYDPLKNHVHDYVGGQEDLAARRIRAIGNPHDRIEEDKLRMLRAIRFASTFAFELEPRTLAAVKKHAPEINVVSGERIGAEMRRMLASPKRAAAARLLRESGLLVEIVPNGSTLFANDQDWELAITRLERLGADGDFETAVSILLEPIIESLGIDVIFEKWKLSNEERKSISWICKNWSQLNHADQYAWSVIQPLLIDPDARRGVAIAASLENEPSAGVVLCRERLAWPQERLDPDPLLFGADLIELGISPGPQFREILDAVRVAQLDGQIESKQDATEMAREFIAENRMSE